MMMRKIFHYLCLSVAILGVLFGCASGSKGKNTENSEDKFDALFSNSINEVQDEDPNSDQKSTIDVSNLDQTVDPAPPITKDNTQTAKNAEEHVKVTSKVDKSPTNDVTEDDEDQEDEENPDVQQTQLDDKITDQDLDIMLAEKQNKSKQKTSLQTSTQKEQKVINNSTTVKEISEKSLAQEKTLKEQREQKRQEQYLKVKRPPKIIIPKTLHYAAKVATPKTLRFYLSRGASLDALNRQGNTALMVALNHKRIDNARCLLQYHPDLTLTNRQGQTPLELATALGLTEIEQLIKMQLDHPVPTSKEESEGKAEKETEKVSLPEEVPLEEE